MVLLGEFLSPFSMVSFIFSPFKTRILILFYCIFMFMFLGSAQVSIWSLIIVFDVLCQSRGKGGTLCLLEPKHCLWEAKLPLFCAFTCVFVKPMIFWCSTMIHLCIICEFWVQQWTHWPQKPREACINCLIWSYIPFGNEI